MFWTCDHEAILCREVVDVNPYTTKKGSTKRSSMWEKIADTLNKCAVPKFRVDKRSVRDHVENLVYKHKKKLQAEEKAPGITPDEPTPDEPTYWIRSSRWRKVAERNYRKHREQAVEKNSIRPGLGGRCSTKNDGEAVRDEEKRLVSEDVRAGYIS
ncbi:uncharacterized protein LOC114975625 [Acropora millepora]|uniref:uncharacterized protein LOC114975625 n=1 Tax=Acropora millepora TaxID=45264 RepID=UPI0010FC7312|nr:uncharacterized protein LOC114975625 [Acropora millepora]